MWYAVLNRFEKEFNSTVRAARTVLPAVKWILEQAFAESNKQAGNENHVLDYVIENIEKYNYANSLVDGLDERKKWVAEEVHS